MAKSSAQPKKLDDLLTAREQVLRLALEALSRIRREHPRWVEARVWLDGGYLSAVLRTVGGRVRYRRHGAEALDQLRQALELKARGMPRPVRGFTNVAEESERVSSVLSTRLGDGAPTPRHPEPSKGSPSVYYHLRGRGGQRIVVRVSDHPPRPNVDETLIDISPTGYSAFSGWFLRRLDELGVGINRDVQDMAG